MKSFNSYLFDISQYVKYIKADSENLNVKCSVPQGPILGPLLVLQYVNDLGFITQDMFCLLFADDTSLPFNGKNINTLKLKVNTIFNDVSKWFHANKLSLNIKIQIIWFTNVINLEITWIISQ